MDCLHTVGYEISRKGRLQLCFHKVTEDDSVHWLQSL